MNIDTHTPVAVGDLRLKLKWLIIGRFLFGVLLLGSSLALQLSGNAAPVSGLFMPLYRVILAIFACSVIYTVIFRFVRPGGHPWPAYLQIVGDTGLISVIIHITGGYTSFFSFLYLLVIIIASMLLYKKGALIIAGACCFEYGLLLYMETIGWLEPVIFGSYLQSDIHYSLEGILYKIAITSIACFAVAILSGFLAEQTKKSRKELVEMEAHVKRVEKMAYIGQMAANLAHEIKNPLASLAGSIQLLRDEMDYNADHDRLMQIVLRETDRLSALVSNFLFFARPPAGKMKEIYLDSALTDILTLFERDTRFSHGIRLKIHLVADVRIMMDPEHLHQVMFNLLLNAAEAIFGEGNITVTTRLAKNRKVEIKIDDTGQGIADDARDMIFDPFYSTKTRGSGLGLSIVHSILETYGCRLKIESRVNKGTTVSFQVNRL